MKETWAESGQKPSSRLYQTNGLCDLGTSPNLSGPHNLNF